MKNKKPLSEKKWKGYAGSNFQEPYYFEKDVKEAVQKLKKKRFYIGEEPWRKQVIYWEDLVKEFGEDLK